MLCTLTSSSIIFLFVCFDLSLGVQCSKYHSHFICFVTVTFQQTASTLCHKCGIPWHKSSYIIHLMLKACFWKDFWKLDIVGTVYRLVIYIQSNKIHRVFQWVSLFSTYVSSTCFAPHRSIIRSIFYKLYSQIWYVVICVLLDTSSSYEVTRACAHVWWGQPCQTLC